MNKEGQLGLGDFKSRTQFTHLTCFAGIKIQRFMAGGNHSWFQIDEFSPKIDNYKLPSAQQEKKEAKLTTKKSNPYLTQKQAEAANDKRLPQMANVEQPVEERDKQNRILSNQEIIERILTIQKQQLEQANYYIQLTFCDTSFCHRFVHFEVEPDYIEQFEVVLNEYIDSLKTAELDGIMHYHLQEMPSKQTLASMDPKDNPLTIPLGKPKKGTKKEPMKDLFGELIDDDESDAAMMESDVDIIMGGGSKAKASTSFYD